MSAEDWERLKPLFWERLGLLWRTHISPKGLLLVIMKNAIKHALRGSRPIKFNLQVDLTCCNSTQIRYDFISSVRKHWLMGFLGALGPAGFETLKWGVGQYPTRA